MRTFIFLFFIILFLSCEKDEIQKQLDPSILTGTYIGLAYISSNNSKVDVKIDLKYHPSSNLVDIEFTYLLTNIKIDYDSLIIKESEQQFELVKQTSDYVIEGFFYSNDSLKMNYTEPGIKIDYFTKKR